MSFSVLRFDYDTYIKEDFALLHGVRRLLESDSAVHSVKLGMLEGTQSKHWSGWAVMEDEDLKLLAIKMIGRPLCVSNCPEEKENVRAGLFKSLATAILQDTNLEAIQGVTGRIQEIDACVAAFKDCAPNTESAPLMQMQVYRLDEFKPTNSVLQLPTNMNLRPASTEDADFVLASMNGFMHDVWDEANLPPAERIKAMADDFCRGNDDEGTFNYILQVDGRPSSMCAVIQTSKATCRIRLLYTPPKMRGKGYGAYIVQAVCAHQIDLQPDLILTLFADKKQATVNRLYYKVGFRPVADASIVNLYTKEEA